MTADGQNQIRQSFNKQDMYSNNHNDFEQKFGNDDYRKGRALGKGTPDMRASENEEVDEFGRVTRGPYTMKNGATYTGQWLNNMRDGHGTQLWPDGSRYEGQWRSDKANG